jgi:hypothetical protein
MRAEDKPLQKEAEIYLYRGGSAQRIISRTAPSMES